MVVLKVKKARSGLGGGHSLWNRSRKNTRESAQAILSLGKRKGKNGDDGTLNEWLMEKADFQMQASEMKHGFTQKLGEFSQRRHDDGNRSRRGTDWKSGKS